jgi:hypothetical protein
MDLKSIPISQNVLPIWLYKHLEFTYFSIDTSWIQLNFLTHFSWFLFLFCLSTWFLLSICFWSSWKWLDLIEMLFNMLTLILLCSGMHAWSLSNQRRVLVVVLFQSHVYAWLISFFFPVITSTPFALVQQQVCSFPSAVVDWHRKSMRLSYHLPRYIHTKITSFKIWS